MHISNMLWFECCKFDLFVRKLVFYKSISLEKRHFVIIRSFKYHSKFTLPDCMCHVIAIIQNDVREHMLLVFSDT